jgi:hypothetical protein
MKNVGVVAIVLMHLCLFAQSALAEECPRYVAPGRYDSPKREWDGADGGIIVNGYVELWGKDGERSGRTFNVWHGTDLSSFDFHEDNKSPKVDYKKLAECGTKFAFVRTRKMLSLNIM